MFGDVVEDQLQVGELKELDNKPPQTGVNCRLGRAVYHVVFLQLLGPCYIA